MERKGLASYLIIGAIAVIILVGATLYFMWGSPSVATKQTIQQQPTTTTTNATIPTTVDLSVTSSIVANANWKTYTNQQDGFAINYPSAWYASFQQPSEWNPSYQEPRFIMSDGDLSLGTDRDYISIVAYDKFKGQNIADIFNGQNEPAVDFLKCESVTFAGQQSYGCHPPSDMSPLHQIFLSQNGLTFEIDDYFGDSTSTKILSTFRFIP